MMQAEQIFPTVQSTLSQFTQVPVERETSLRGLGYDSLEMVEMILEVELAPGVELCDDDLAKMSNVGQLVDFIVAKVAH